MEVGKTTFFFYMKESKKEIKIEPHHYYMEGTRLVFTEQYHIDRGHCCGSSGGCRHCPYEPKGVRGNTTLIKKER